jgi:hypothetical protein
MKYLLTLALLLPTTTVFAQTKAEANKFLDEINVPIATINLSSSHVHDMLQGLKPFEGMISNDIVWTGLTFADKLDSIGTLVVIYQGMQSDYDRKAVRIILKGHLEKTIQGGLDGDKYLNQLMTKVSNTATLAEITKLRDSYEDGLRQLGQLQGKLGSTD